MRIFRNSLDLVIAISIILLTTQCTANKAYSKKSNIPEWVVNHPINSNYFVGIGSAPIIKKQNSHIEKARKDALNELASEISVQLSSSNILITLVKNDKISEEFNSLIRSKVITDLSDYELVDTYSDKKNYWIYYRLSKQKYFEQQLEKKNIALKTASTFYTNALNSEISGDIKTAISDYVKTIDALKLYLNEDNTVDINNEKVNLTVSAFMKLNSIITSLKIVPDYSVVNGVFSLDIDSKVLTYKLIDNSGNLIKGFPVIAHYSERAIPNPSSTTDDKALVRYAIGKIRSLKQEENFTVMPDINSILISATSDYTVRKAVSDIPLQKISIPVYIKKPSIRFNVVSQTSDKTNYDDLIANTFLNRSLLSNYSTAEISDYICKVIINTRQVNYSGGVYTVELTGTIQLFDNKNNIKYSVQISPVRGMQISMEKAKNEAYSNFQQQINSRYFREIEEAILK